MIFRVIRLPQNQGHGIARRKSLEACSCGLVAIMDADDISLPNRFADQLELFRQNPALDVCGGQITEFAGDENNVTGERVVKLSDYDIKRDLKKRCPMNQVSVMMKKSSYEQAGGYLDWYCEEDYYLWARMALNKCVFANTDKVVVNVRTGLEMSSRRGGIKYFSSEKRMQRFLLKKGLISFPRYIYNVMVRFVGEVLSPNWLRNRLFRLTRKKITIENARPLEQKKTVSNGPAFSVAMCVYGKDNPDSFARALQSVIVEQTAKPSEIVLVVDGPVSDELDAVIGKYTELANALPTLLQE